jgi:N6-L-threonylcarbamoyladenine synthase
LKTPRIVLGIETSCDETGVALVDEEGRVLSHALYSQVDEHQAYKGVVPENAARAHLHHLDVLVKQALDEANLSLCDVDALAATGGPGLIGGVMVGVTYAKALAFSLQKPFLAVNHLAAHVLMIRLLHPVAFPFLTLLVSGGHCQLLCVRGLEDILVLGETLDDAVGECFDKCARLLGFPYPGGPAIEKAAIGGNPQALSLPRPFARDPHIQFDFSFSGMKAAFRRAVEIRLDQGPFPPSEISDYAASLQEAIIQALLSRSRHALEWAQQTIPAINHFIIAGGVAANQALRSRFEQLTKEYGVTCLAPPPSLCTDNGVMIAWAGIEKLKKGQLDSLDFKPRPRWPLGEKIR